MLRYSNQILLKKTQSQLLGLEMDLIRNPGNEKIISLIEEKKKQIKWIEKENELGHDPGVHIL